MGTSSFVSSLSFFIVVAGASVTALVAPGCATVAVAVAPDKKPVPDDSAEFHAAESQFWSALHGGEYEKIGPTLDLYERAYLANPSSPMTAARIGWLHTWRLAESARQREVSPTITDDVTLGRKYFGEATRLSPKESRFLGFYASLTMAEGAIHHDAAEKSSRLLHDERRNSTRGPEFNLFTAGISVARLPYENPIYEEGVTRQWENLDVCIDAKIDRNDGRYDQLHGNGYEIW